MCVSIMGWGCQPWDGVWDVAKASIGIGRGGEGQEGRGCVSIMGWGCQPWDGDWGVGCGGSFHRSRGRGRKAEGVPTAWLGGVVGCGGSQGLWNSPAFFYHLLHVCLDNILHCYTTTLGGGGGGGEFTYG